MTGVPSKHQVVTIFFQAVFFANNDHFKHEALQVVNNSLELTKSLRL